MQKPYTDIDYDSFPVADLTADIHWIQLPAARWAPIREKLQEDRLNPRLANLPKNHQVILVPADPDYSPAEEDVVAHRQPNHPQDSRRPARNALHRRRRRPRSPRRTPRLAQSPARQALHLRPPRNELTKQEKVKYRKNKPGDLIQNKRFDPLGSDLDGVSGNPIFDN